jgi:DNA-binding CsgD family transcriptional regulator
MNGQSVYQVAQRHGINRKTVSAILHRHGAVMRRQGLTGRQIQESIRLYRDGLSTRLIGSRFGVTDKTVGRALVQAGVVLRPRRGNRSSSPNHDV